MVTQSRCHTDQGSGLPTIRVHSDNRFGCHEKARLGSDRRTLCSIGMVGGEDHVLEMFPVYSASL